MNEDMSLPEPAQYFPRSAMRPAGPSRHLDADWVAAPTYVDSRQPGGPDVTSYLHALRRRWLVAFTLGTLCAMAVAATVWFLYLPEYTAEYYLKVSETEQRLLADTDSPITKFDTYKRTQQQMMKNQRVLNAALRDLGDLSILRSQEDDAWWVRKELNVDFPGDAEVMRVSLKGKNEDEVRQVVTAVVDSYQALVVDAEAAARMNRRQALDDARTSAERELTKKRVELEELERSFGATENDTLPFKQQNKIRELFEYHRELRDLQLQYMLAGGEIDGASPEDVKEEDVKEGDVKEGDVKEGDVKEGDVKEGDVKEGDIKEEDIAVDPYELYMAERSDPLTLALLRRSMELEAEVDQVSGTASPEVAAKYQERRQAELVSVGEQLEKRREDLRSELQQGKKALAEFEKRKRDVKIQVLAMHMDKLEEVIKGLEGEVEGLKGPTIDILMLRNEVEVLDRTVGTITNEVEKLKVESASGGRVESISEKAVSRCTNWHIRTALAILAGTAGLFLPILAIVFWDTRGQRVNSPVEISEEIGLDVIGELPVIPHRAVRHMVGSSPRYHHWQAMLTESVDGIAARVLRQAESDPVRVIMVTSAVGGEGKTTVATQLAMSLARTGRRTVLVDFDLRQPSLDGVFGIPMQPGVGELLKHEIELRAAVHDGQSEKLSVITAGVWNRGSVEVLANGSTSTLFEELRADYDFVIVDCSPILPVVDTRFISQHVDGVVLSVLRDIAEYQKLRRHARSWRHSTCAFWGP